MSSSEHSDPQERLLSREAFLKEGLNWLRRSGEGIVYGAVSPFIPDEKPSHQTVACIELTECTAYRGSGCVACYEACPEKEQAIIITEDLPQVIATNCTGCEECLPACPAEGAISMIPTQFVSAI